MSTLELGPFHVQQFLVPSLRTHLPHGVLSLEEFKLTLTRPDHAPSTIGLDDIHQNNASVRGSLGWEGNVTFSSQAKNRKQISRQGMQELQLQAQTKGFHLNWEVGFCVKLLGRYWRHSYSKCELLFIFHMPN